MRASSVDQIIINLLKNENGHLTSMQVYEKIRNRLPAVNQSTVYRALERLGKNGTISISDMGTGSTVYEYLSEVTHHHLVCQECGSIITLDDHEIHQLLSAIETQHDFQIITRHLILFGVCANCQKSASLLHP